MTHPSGFADISIFHQESAIFVTSENTNNNCIFNIFLKILLTLIEYLKLVSNQHDQSFDIVIIATQDLLKLKVL